MTRPAIYHSPLSVTGTGIALAECTVAAGGERVSRTLPCGTRAGRGLTQRVVRPPKEVPGEAPLDENAARAFHAPRLRRGVFPSSRRGRRRARTRSRRATRESRETSRADRSRSLSPARSSDLDTLPMPEARHPAKWPESSHSIVSSADDSSLYLPQCRTDISDRFRSIRGL